MVKTKDFSFPQKGVGQTGRPMAPGLLSSGRLDGNPDIYLVNTDGTNLRRMTRNNNSDWEPSWSPDGEWLLFVSGNPTDIYIMSASDGKTYRLTSDSYSNWACLASLKVPFSTQISTNNRALHQSGHCS